MPNEAEAHLALHRAMSGVPRADADVAPPAEPVETHKPSATPVVGGETSAPLEEALNRDDRRP